MPVAPQTASTATTTTMTQQQLENIAASHTFNEAIQSGSPFKVATEEAAAAARVTRTYIAAAAAVLKSIEESNSE